MNSPLGNQLEIAACISNDHWSEIKSTRNEIPRNKFLLKCKAIPIAF